MNSPANCPSRATGKSGTVNTHVHKCFPVRFKLP
jgi:hypothetical protein